MYRVIVICDILVIPFIIINDYHTMTAFDNQYIEIPSILISTTIELLFALPLVLLVGGLAGIKIWSWTLQHMSTCTDTSFCFGGAYLPYWPKIWCNSCSNLIYHNIFLKLVLCNKISLSLSTTAWSAPQGYAHVKHYTKCLV